MPKNRDNFEIADDTYFTLSRLPVEYFLTQGHGESDYGRGESGAKAAEAGSWDACLRKAKIADQNIIKYTSLVPKEAKRISRKKGRKLLRWGNVLEVIAAQKNGQRGDQITAALLITSIHDKKGKYLGSFACEYSGNGDTKVAKQVLISDVTEMVNRRGYGVPSKTAIKKILLHGEDYITHRKIIRTSRGYTYRPKHFLVQTMKIKKKYGTVMSALCYTKFRWKIVNP